MSSSQSNSESYEDVLEMIEFLIDEVTKFRSSIHRLLTELNPHNRSALPMIAPFSPSTETPVRDHVISCIKEAGKHLDNLKNCDPARHKNQPTQTLKKHILKTVLLGEVDRTGFDKIRNKVESTLHQMTKKRERKLYMKADDSEAYETLESPTKKVFVPTSTKVQKIMTRDESSYTPLELIQELKTYPSKVQQFFSILDVVKVETTGNITSLHVGTSVSTISDTFSCLFTNYLLSIWSVKITCHFMPPHSLSMNHTLKSHVLNTKCSKTFPRSVVKPLIFTTVIQFIRNSHYRPFW